MDANAQAKWDDWADARIARAINDASKHIATVLGGEVGVIEKTQRKALEDGMAAVKAEMRSEMGRIRQQIREEAAAAMVEPIRRLEERIEELSRQPA